jgi:adenine-specific DNA-methyltransferase
MIWEKKYRPQNDAKWLSVNHDFILIYPKNKESWRPNLLERTKKQNQNYSNEDSDSRGDWTSSGLMIEGVTKNN